MNETPLLDQIRVYSEALVEDLPNPATDVVNAPVPLAARPAQRNLGWLVAMAAAALIVILVGAAAWLSPLNGTAVPPADEPAETTIPVATTAPEAEDVTETTVTATTEATVPVPPSGEGPKGPAETFEDPIVLQAEAGPAPRFDTSPLGLEVVFEPSHPDYDLADHLSELVFYSGPRGEYPFTLGDRLEDRLMALVSDEELLVLTEPILYVGRTPENGWELILVTTGETLCSMLFPGTAAACGPSGGDNYGLNGAAGGSTAAITVRVPLETSVVAIITPDGQRFWQRPIGGWGVFEVPLWPEGTPGPTVIAFDADGIQIGQW